MRKFIRYALIISQLLIMLALTACMTPPPRNTHNICSVFRQYPKWYAASRHVAQRWGVPINVQMAIMRQESDFQSHARPPRTKLLWIIPWTRPSTAYGYSQVLDGTWRYYKNDTGKYFVNRTNFKDAVNFIGWYSALARRKAGIQPNDAYKLYLAYHEGCDGYNQRTYFSKRWLMAVAQKVKRQAAAYQIQLMSCEPGLQARGYS